MYIHICIFQNIKWLQIKNFLFLLSIGSQPKVRNKTRVNVSA